MNGSLQICETALGPSCGDFILLVELGADASRYLSERTWFSIGA